MKHKGINPARREPSGRIARPTLKQLEEIERNRRLAETQTVRSQPHRSWAREPADTKLETPFGQFCVANKLADDLYQAGEHYTGLWRKWRLAVGIPCPYGHSSEGTGAEPGHDPDGFLRQIESADSAMQKATATGKVAIIRMCGHRESVTASMQMKAIPALVALAVHFGMRRADLHPFAA